MQMSCISHLLNDIYCTAQNALFVCTLHFLNLNFYTVQRKNEIKIFILQFKSFYFKTIHVATTQ